MEGISYTGQETPAAAHRERSATAPENTPAPVGSSFYATLPDLPPPPQLQLQPHPQAQPHAQPLQPYQATSHIQPLAPPYTASQNQTIDHSAGLNSVPHSSHNNITYNHMSGSVDIFPTAPKGKTSSREESGTREESKPPLYNIPWSDEEQQLLEKLLDEFPDEPVAAQRFQKISAAMGTRTPKQVASRVQKYFIKLVKAGLEAPGRMNYSLESKPKNKGAAANIKGKKRKDAPVGEGAIKPKASRPKKKDSAEMGLGTGAGNRRQKAKSLLSTGSGRTSGTQYLHYSSAPTVYMSEEDDEESVQDMLAVSNNSNTAGSDASNNGIISHLGFACDACGVDPILGVRDEMATHQQPQFVDSDVLKALVEDKTKIPGKDYLVVDVRDTDYEGGHIPGCLNIPASELPEKLPILIEEFKEVPQLFFHCALSQVRGPKAANRWSAAIAERDAELAKTEAAAAVAADQGPLSQKVHILRGGFTEWQHKHKDDKNLVADYKAEYWVDY
ncbi:hypothetical protein BGZ50_006181 [Haplosporangium sp. Z 11]|nr:hypothetical protein BGZ50_006181 [Haplosporangium sp. Z 11]